jgi:hypothetical protein
MGKIYQWMDAKISGKPISKMFIDCLWKGGNFKGRNIAETVLTNWSRSASSVIRHIDMMNSSICILKTWCVFWDIFVRNELGTVLHCSQSQHSEGGGRKMVSLRSVKAT